MFIGELNYKPILDHSRKNKYVMGWGGGNQTAAQSQSRDD